MVESWRDRDEAMGAGLAGLNERGVKISKWRKVDGESVTTALHIMKLSSKNSIDKQHFL